MKTLKPQFLKLLFILILSLAACTHYQVSDPSKASTQLYPDGNYRHFITMELSGGRSQKFQGVVSIKPESIVIVGLSPFGNSMFRITDSRGKDEPKFDIYFEPLRKYEPKLRQFYSLLRELLILPSNGESKSTSDKVLDAQSRLSSLNVTADKKTTLTFGNYDLRNIPLHVRIERDDFKVDIEVGEYEI